MDEQSSFIFSQTAQTKKIIGSDGTLSISSPARLPTCATDFVQNSKSTHQRPKHNSPSCPAWRTQIPSSIWPGLSVPHLSPAPNPQRRLSTSWYSHKYAHKQPAHFVNTANVRSRPSSPSSTTPSEDLQSKNASSAHFSAAEVKMALKSPLQTATPCPTRRPRSKSKLTWTTRRVCFNCT